MQEQRRLNNRKINQCHEFYSFLKFIGNVRQVEKKFKITGSKHQRFMKDA